MHLLPINHVLRRIDQALVTVLCVNAISCQQGCIHNPVQVRFTSDSIWHETTMSSGLPTHSTGC